MRDAFIRNEEKEVKKKNEERKKVDKKEKCRHRRVIAAYPLWPTEKATKKKRKKRI